MTQFRNDAERIRGRSLEILSGLGSCPAVAYQEGLVASFICKTVEGMGLDVEADRHGNLIVRLGAPSEDPPIAFMAHMDHPGFEGLEIDGARVIAAPLGGVPAASLTDRVPVEAVLSDGTRVKGVTAGRHGSDDDRRINVELESAAGVRLPLPIVFDLVDFDFDGDLVHMRALDDLAGCAAILVALEQMKDEAANGEVYGIFTRAEEVGLVGARLLAEDGTLPRETLVVSLEASRTLPGAAIGEGPVIRVGDASFTFDAEAESVLLKAREELSQRDSGFKAQRQLMSGGTCEASGFRFYGYRSTGIAFPLGNYHNAAPDGSVQAEHIHIDDFVGGVLMSVEAARSVGARTDAPPWRRFREIPEEMRRRLVDQPLP